MNKLFIKVSGYLLMFTGLFIGLGGIGASITNRDGAQGDPLLLLAIISFAGAGVGHFITVMADEPSIDSKPRQYRCPNLEVDALIKKSKRTGFSQDFELLAKDDQRFNK